MKKKHTNLPTSEIQRVIILYKRWLILQLLDFTGLIWITIEGFENILTFFFCLLSTSRNNPEFKSQGLQNIQKSFNVSIRLDSYHFHSVHTYVVSSGIGSKKMSVVRIWPKIRITRKVGGQRDETATIFPWAKWGRNRDSKSQRSPTEYIHTNKTTGVIN